MATVAGTGLDAAAVEALRAAVRGALLRPGDADYDAARRVWNGMIDRRPALIARCAGAADVIKGVAFAREHGLLVAVRGGGHNVTGNAVCDDGLMLDLSPMKGIRVDPARLTVRAEAGVTWGELDRETQAFGLATTGGQVSTTGIAGLTLGGGIGWLMRKYGLAIDNLLSADVVTADGRLLTASADENPDLFWGIRGGGGNFGVVTSFEYRLHRVGPMITGGMALYPAARAAELLRFFRALTADAPEDLNVVLAFLTAPPAPFVPPELVGTPLVGFALGHLGTPEEGQAAIERIRAFGAPAIDLLGPMPYTALQSMTDGALPFGLRVYLKSSHLTGLDDALIDTVVRQMQAVTSPLSQVVIVPLGDAGHRFRSPRYPLRHRRLFRLDRAGRGRAAHALGERLRRGGAPLRPRRVRQRDGR